MRSILPLAAVLAATACSPQNAELTEGTYTMFMAAGSSRTLFEDSIRVEDAQNHYNIDCRALPDDVEGLPDPIDICERTPEAGDVDWPPIHEGWIRNDGFSVVQEDLAPWRGEAVITSEGDLQVTFHHHPPGIDMRFAFAVDPHFAPQRCIETDGELEFEPIDGADWIEEWSRDVDGELYLLNAVSYQFNPSQPEEQIWVLPDEWSAGYARGKFGAEEMYMRSVRFGRPAAYMAFEDSDAELSSADLFYVEEIEAGEDPAGDAEYQAEIARVVGISELIAGELDLLQVPTANFGADDRTPSDYSPKVETNEWRLPDGSASGLDRWIELHYNWVRFDPGADLSVGGSASGEFSLMYDALESQSVLVVAGEFTIDRIKRDKWVTGDVEQQKLEESGTTICGEDPVFE